MAIHDQFQGLLQECIDAIHPHTEMSPCKKAEKIRKKILNGKIKGKSAIASENIAYAYEQRLHQVQMSRFTAEFMKVGLKAIMMCYPHHAENPLQEAVNEGELLHAEVKVPYDIELLGKLGMLTKKKTEGVISEDEFNTQATELREAYIALMKESEHKSHTARLFWIKQELHARLMRRMADEMEKPDNEKTQIEIERLKGALDSVITLLANNVMDETIKANQ